MPRPSEIVVVAPRALKPVSAEAVADAERALDVRFPADYHELVLRHGEAAYCNDVRIYGPAGVVAQNTEWRLGEGKYFFWQEEPFLPRAEVPRCVRFVDTFDGDQVALHPERPGRLYVFPRHLEQMFEIEGTLHDALEWVLTSGTLRTPTHARFIEPMPDRVVLWEGRWRETDPSFERAVSLICALDPASRAVPDVWEGDEVWTQIFLPGCEARARVVARSHGLSLELISFLEDRAPLERLRRGLRAAGVDITDRSK